MVLFIKIVLFNAFFLTIVELICLDRELTTQIEPVLIGQLAFILKHRLVRNIPILELHLFFLYDL
jgi:hypothetical protein